MNNYKKPIWIALAGLLAGVTAWAADDAQKVLSDLHNANQMEITMGRMAKEKGASDLVRTYGDRLIKDHEDADKQVQDLAKKDGITLAAKPTSGAIDHFVASREQNKMADLSKKTGADFDKAFAEAMVDDHQRDIRKLKNAEKSLEQSDVRELVAKLLPTLQQHLELAKQIQKTS